MNVIISDRATNETIVRYEIHRSGGSGTPSDREYFDDAWERAVSDALVDTNRRDGYRFQLQRPKTLYESSE